MRRAISVTILCTLLSACGSTGALNSDLLSQPLPRRQSRISIVRSTDLLYVGGSATITLDGRPLADLGRGGSLVQNIETGRHRLDVSTPTAPGNFAITFTSVEGKLYEFEISPRSENYVVSAVFGLVGSVVDAQVNENTGPFKILPKT